MDDEPLLNTPRFSVVRRTRTLPDGSSHAREVVLHPGAVVVVALLDAETVCLIRNRRVAVDQTLVELPAGTLEPGEAPAAAAARELVEETGYRAARIERLAEFWMSPGILRERMHLYLATGLEQVGSRLDLGESIEPLPVRLDVALAWIERGEIQDAKSIAGLLWYDRFRRAGNAGAAGNIQA